MKAAKAQIQYDRFQFIWRLIFGFLIAATACLALSAIASGATLWMLPVALVVILLLLVLGYGDGL